MNIFEFLKARLLEISTYKGFNYVGIAIALFHKAQAIAGDHAMGAQVGAVWLALHGLIEIFKKEKKELLVVAQGQ